MADRLEHPPDLLIPYLVQRDLVPWIFSAHQRSDVRGRQSFFVNVDAPLKAREVTFVRFTRDFYMIDLRYDSRLGHELRELAIIGKNNQSLRPEIESSNGIDSLFDFTLHIIDDRGTA